MEKKWALGWLGINGDRFRLANKSNMSAEVAHDLKKGRPMDLYTKNGRPLQVGGDTVYSQSGQVVGRINGDRVFGTDGRYVGTIVDDRLVFRSTDSAAIGSAFASARRAGIARANRAGAAMWGDEPNIPG